jgi:hypothetical protein
MNSRGELSMRVQTPAESAGKIRAAALVAVAGGRLMITASSSF